MYMESSSNMQFVIESLTIVFARGSLCKFQSPGGLVGAGLSSTCSACCLAKSYRYIYTVTVPQYTIYGQASVLLTMTKCYVNSHNTKECHVEYIMCKIMIQCDI